MKVRVYNDNDYEFRENFRDNEIVIGPKKYIEMERDQALIFKGSFAPVKLNADGVPTKESRKMIRIVPIPGEVAESPVVNEDICQACSYEATSKADLSEHIKANHADIAVRDEEAEREMARKKKAKAS